MKTDPPKPHAPPDPIYLFSSFRGNGEDGLHLAHSLDGIKWLPLKNDASFLAPTAGEKLMRDPCVILGPDGVYHMSWTTSWTQRGIGIAHSKNLIDWSEQAYVPVMEHEPLARNTWAPEITWDAHESQYIIYWASTIPGRFKETDGSSEEGYNHRIYHTTTRDFKTYSQAALLYDPGFNIIDSSIVQDADRYVMIFKDETLNPPAKNLRVAFSKKATGPYGPASRPFSPSGQWVEGPAFIKIGDWWLVYFDLYDKGRYGGMRTRDFVTWEDISDEVEFPAGTRHGSVFTATPEILALLVKE